jgi:hypothetical protein
VQTRQTEGERGGGGDREEDQDRSTHSRRVTRGRRRG